MEDQRNWTDASFKTYCRPLAAPRPYRLVAGEPVRQSIAIEVADAVGAEGEAGRRVAPGAGPEAASEADASGPPTGRMPALLLAVEPDWLAVPAVDVDGLLVRVGAGSAWSDAKLDELARVHDRLGGALDLEIVVADGEPARETLEARRPRCR